MTLVQLLFAFLLGSLFLGGVDLRLFETVGDAVKRVHAIGLGLEVVLESRHLGSQIVDISRERSLVSRRAALWLVVAGSHVAVACIDIVIVLVVLRRTLTIIDEVV